MTGEGHVIFAIATAIFAKRAELTPVLAQADWWHLISASLITCLLPDIDHPKSLLGQRLKWLSYPIARAFGHRGFTHSLLAVAASLWLFQINVPDDWLLPADAAVAVPLALSSADPQKPERQSAGAHALPCAGRLRALVSARLALFWCERLANAAV